ncbi:peptide hydrolase [Trypanosoma cruzi]|nr:peptide hydrolase [Trypanosoma cruzi]
MSGAARSEFNRSSFAAILCVEDDTPHGCGLTHGRQDRFSCVVVRSAHFPTHTPSLLSQLLQGWTSVIKAVAGLPRNAGTADTHLDNIFSTLEVCVQVRILRAAAIWTSLPEASVDPILRASILCNFVPDPSPAGVSSFLLHVRIDRVTFYLLAVRTTSTDAAEPFRLITARTAHCHMLFSDHNTVIEGWPDGGVSEERKGVLVSSSAAVYSS